jgi:hypothetical protein
MEPVAPDQDVLREQWKTRLVVGRQDASAEIRDDQ